MKQSIVIFLMTVFLAVFAAPASRGDPALPGEPVALRETVTVNSSLVRLGDLFTGAGEKSPAVVAYAPGPGERVTRAVNTSSGALRGPEKGLRAL